MVFREFRRSFKLVCAEYERQLEISDWCIDQLTVKSNSIVQGVRPNS